MTFRDPEIAPILVMRGVTLQYQTESHFITATQRVGFDVYRADRLTLVGPSGCGKSSLLKAIGGYLAPLEGSITLNGRQVSEPGPDRMMVFQEFDQLLPWKTALSNVAYPMFVSKRWPREEILDRARTALDKVNLAKFTDAYPHTLSGGMKQRVAIARAMAMEPDILLMDEPYAALDAFTRRKMQEELLELWQELRFTLLFVTHSIEEALLIGSRVIVLSAHPGRLCAEINCHELDHSNQGSPAFQKLAQRIHQMLFAPDSTAAA